MSSSIIYLGMDVHKESVTIAVLPQAAAEASGAGYVLQRALREWGYACEVIAPSLIPTKPGHQRKHDKRDAARAN